MTQCHSIHSKDDLRLPPEYRKKLFGINTIFVKQILRKNKLNTVCEDARCPNISECFSHKTATFMIMGDKCTRRCKFCSVTTKKPSALDINEPYNMAKAIEELRLDYVVITSVDRDDLDDYGVNHFIAVINHIKSCFPKIKIELLTPDFKGRLDLIDLLLDTPIDVFGHNIETISRLYKHIRPQSDFLVTTKVLAHVAKNKHIVTKTAMMVGLGETDEEVVDNLQLIKSLGVQTVNIGQYLRPSLNHWPVDRYVSQESFLKFRQAGKNIGFNNIFADSFVRSSYNAKESFLSTQLLV